MLEARSNRATARAADGDIECALTESESVVADTIRWLGATHPLVLVFRQNLVALRYRDDPAGLVDSLAELTAEWDQYEAEDTDDDPEPAPGDQVDTAKLELLVRLAAARTEAGDVDRALSDLSEMINEAARALGPDDPEVLRIRFALARAHMAAGHPTAAARQLAALFDDACSAPTTTCPCRSG